MIHRQSCRHPEKCDCLAVRSPAVGYAYPVFDDTGAVRYVGADHVGPSLWLPDVDGHLFRVSDVTP